MDDLDVAGAPWRGLRWLFPTRTATARARRLQDRVGASEVGSSTYVDDKAVGQATIHTRQDLVLMVQWQSEHHRQLVNISRGVWIMGFLILLALDAG